MIDVTNTLSKQIWWTKEKTTRKFLISWLPAELKRKRCDQGKSNTIKERAHDRHQASGTLLANKCSGPQRENQGILVFVVPLSISNHQHQHNHWQK